MSLINLEPVFDIDPSNGLDTETPFMIAVDILNGIPPIHLQDSLTEMIQILPDHTKDLIDAIDLSPSVLICSETNKKFLCCKWNQDLNCYKSPWSSTDLSDIRDNQSLNQLREFEIMANLVFEKYTNLYYKNGISSVYVKDQQSGIEMNILIKVQDEVNGTKIGWDSIHFIKIESEDDIEKYILDSTVMIYILTECSIGDPVISVRIKQKVG
jgi:capping protein (actin filament) muscle Z-line, beta